MCILKGTVAPDKIGLKLILWSIGTAFGKIKYKEDIKGIDRSFELRGEIRLIRSVMRNWRLGNFFYLILNGLHHKISKKPIVAA
jgi:hypothetical protein